MSNNNAETEYGYVSLPGRQRHTVTPIYAICSVTAALSLSLSLSLSLYLVSLSLYLSLLLFTLCFQTERHDSLSNKLPPYQASSGATRPAVFTASEQKDKEQRKKRKKGEKSNKTRHITAENGRSRCRRPLFSSDEKWTV